MQVQVINKSSHPLPKYETEHAAALDIRVVLEAPITLKPLERAVLPTGLYFAIPAGYELQIRSRSGLAARNGIMTLNSPGTIDADYRGELKIIIANVSNDDYTIQDGDRMAQAVIGPCERIEWEPVEVLDETARGTCGFGSTGR